MIKITFFQGLYITLSTLGILLVLLLLWILYYRNRFSKKHLTGAVSRKLYRYANINDYLLLNDYGILIDQKHVGEINHILVTNKYIVVIHDFSISGVVSGMFNDEHLKVVNKEGEKLIANPLNYNRNLTKRVALFNNLDSTFLKGVVVINNDSFIDINDMPNQFKMCKKKDLLKVINEFEKDDVKPFKEKTVVDFINILNKNNIKGEKK